MTPQQFVAKWRDSALKERSGSQPHFLDLCALLGILDPVSADPTGDSFTFERGASKTGGGQGWADVWKKGCFAWEYKGPHANLDKALAQLLQYAADLENPPLLIVSDMDVIRVHTNFTNTVQQVHTFTLDDMMDGAQRDRLKNAFTDPFAFKPSQTRAELTEETAGEFAALAQRLRDRGHESHVVAHFINRLAFCMFAEDAALLPEKLFTRLLNRASSRPEKFAGYADKLFAAMRTGGELDFVDIAWFNGGLFDDAPALALTGDDVDLLYKAARRDWSQIDPSILGTLFERGLDPDKRSQLGAHYTDRAKIMLIVQPVIIDPLMAEWAEVKAQIEALVAAMPRRTAERLLTPAEKRKAEKLRDEASALHIGFIERLAAFRVLDPACGSGNFLYVALRALKDIEHRVNLDAEALGLPRPFLRTGPENVLGIELNPYAAELARVSVWIGELQWVREHGYTAASNPILRPLDNIECRDAVLAWEPAPHTSQSTSPRPPSRGPAALPGGEAASGIPDQVRDDLAGEGALVPVRAHWPQADVVVGNPPFLGNKKMIAELGEDYTRALRKAWPQVPGGADLVCYWFAAAWDRMVAGQLTRAGLVSTNSIRGGANREVLKPIVEHGRIFEAWSDEGWTVDGAAVRVSLVCFDGERVKSALLDGESTVAIGADLTSAEKGNRLVEAVKLPENTSIAFQGGTKAGSFDILAEVARDWIKRPNNPNGLPNSQVLRPWINAMDVTRRPSDKWIVDFGWKMSESECALFEAPFDYCKSVVWPERQLNRRDMYRQNWWRFAEPRQGMWNALKGTKRFLVTPMVAKHRVFAWFHHPVWPSNLLNVIARDDDTTFGILHSRFHELWSLRMGTSLEDRPRYTPSTTFETFPFPEGLTPDIPAADYAADPRAQAIAAAAARLNQLRENWLNPDDLVTREPEVVPGYPDRILPRDEAAAKELKQRTLTNLYNARPAWLDHAHRALDEAVAEAYGWGDDWRSGALTEDEILARLFRLNQERSGK